MVWNELEALKGKESAMKKNEKGLGFYALQNAIFASEYLTFRIFNL